jgi:alkylation response protein AidB-like acyl-CoA dehydrogenase
VTTFVFTREQQELRRTVRRFLADKSPPEQVRRLMDTEDGYDPATWSQLSGQLGLVGLTVPEEYGGSGCGPVEQLIVCEEMGRVLLGAPYLSTAVPHPDPRWHRLHLGTRRAPGLPASQIRRGDAGHTRRAPGPRRPAISSTLESQTGTRPDRAP